MLRLTASYGGASRRHPLAEGRSVSIGAARDNDFVVPFPGVSRRHARIEPSRDEVVVIDLGSKNGLVVAGERRDRVVLEIGDQVLIGRAVLTLDEVAPADLEMALVLDAPDPREASPTTRGTRPGETAPHWAFHLVRDLESLSPDAGEARRASVLAGIADAVGAVSLWSFAVVEGDLFLRDCVGAVPSNEAIAWIAEAVLREDARPPRRPLELEEASGWTLVCPPLTGTTPVLVTRHPRTRRPDPWTADLLVHLAERLRLLEGELSSEDLPAVVRLFLVQAAARYGKRIQGIGRRALELLQARPWDGRMRELEHAIEGAVLRCPEGGAVEASHFSDLELRPMRADSSGSASVDPEDTLATGPVVPLTERLDDVERAAIRDALERASGDRAGAAHLLGISLEDLNRRMARLGLE